MVPKSTTQGCFSENGEQICGPQYGDLVSKNTLAGQNSRPPSEKMFGSHYIVKVLPPDPSQPPVVPLDEDQYFDPSYGVTYKNQDDFEDKAVDGYALRIGQTNIFIVKKSTGLKKIVFNAQ